MAITVEGMIHPVLKHSCDSMGWPYDHIDTKKRKQEHVEARQLLMFWMKESLGFSWVKIAEIFGQNHSTIISGYDKAKHKLSRDEEYRIELVLLSIRTESLFWSSVDAREIIRKYLLPKKK